jgi:serine/threonine protein kinase
MPSLFISYRRSDSPDTVKLIHERLKQRLPRWEIFYDIESIPLGEQFPERLRAKVTESAVVLVVIGPRWLEILNERRSAPVDHVRLEVQLSLEVGTSVVPVLVGRAAMPTEADLAQFADLQPLLQRNGRPVRPDPDFDGDLESIIAHLKQLDSDEAVGATLDDRYTLTAEIGYGGMGVVYLAEQKQPVRRTVAVKLIKPGMDSRDVLARFDAERQALAIMDHPNIARVLDAGMSARGRPFFVMEYVKGVPITQYCDEKKLTPQERLILYIPVCNAVQHAHQKGIIHRDLKPSNVLVEVVDGKPVPKVIDFGLAKALGQKLTDQTLYTALDTRVGTLEYSAPEQATGRSFDVDTRSDIYSLGVLLYELLTGAPPFTHEELLKVGEEEMRRVIREEEPTKPSKKLSSSGELPAIAARRQLEPSKLTRFVRGDLDWIVMKCLEKERDRRYKNANDIGEELQRFLANEPVLAGPPSAAYRLRKFVRRHKASLLTTTGVLLATVLGVAIAFWQIKNALEGEKNAKTLVETQKEVLQDALEKKNKAQELGYRDFIRAQMGLAQEAWDRGDARGVLDALDEQRPSDTNPDLRAFEWYHFWQLCHTDLVTASGYNNGANWFTTSSSDRWFLWNVHTDQTWPIPLEVITEDKYPVASVNGKLLASRKGKSVKIWDLAQGQLRVALHDPPDKITRLLFSFDNKTLATVDSQGVKLWDTSTGRQKRSAETSGPGHIVFAPDDKTMVILEKESAKRWDLTTDSKPVDFVPPLNQLVRNPYSFTSVLYSPDGKRLALGKRPFSGGAQVTIWDVSSLPWKEGRSVPGSRDRVLSRVGPTKDVVFSRDGQRLAWSTDQNDVIVWDITTGKQAGILRGHTSAIHAVTFSADGMDVVTGSADTTVKLWSLRPEAERGPAEWIERATFKGHLAPVTAVTFRDNNSKVMSLPVAS